MCLSWRRTNSNQASAPSRPTKNPYSSVPNTKTTSVLTVTNRPKLRFSAANAVLLLYLKLFKCLEIITMLK